MFLELLSTLWTIWAAAPDKIDPAWIALGGTIVGTIGLKVAETLLGRGRVRIDDAAKIRDELRQSVQSQRQEIAELDKEVDKWKKDYYDLRDKSSDLNTQLSIWKDKAEQQSKDNGKDNGG